MLRPFKAVSWKKIEDGLSALRSFTLTVLLLGSLLGVIGFTIVELRRDVVVIDPIRLPASLRNMGYSEDVAALRLWDAVVQINEATPTVKDRVALLPASQRVDFEAPGAGMSMQTIVRMLRRFLDLGETRIAGEFICESTACNPESLALRLRVFRNDRMDIIYLPPVGARPGGGTQDNKEIDRYFDTAALELLRYLDPYMVAFYLYQTDKVAAEREALKLIGPLNQQLKWGLNLLGLIAADKGDHQSAIDWYRRASTDGEGGEFAVAFINWGDALRATGDTDGAIEKYQRAAEIDPEDALAHNNWGIALREMGDFDGAIARFTHATTLAPGDVSIYNDWGSALFGKGDLDQAIAKFQRATELAPNYAPAHFNWGIVLDKKGDLEGAIVKFARAATLDPDDVEALNSWGIALRRVGDLDGATAKFKRATEIDPENASAHNNWGSALGTIGDIEGAITKFTRAAEINPRDANAHFNRALALRMLNRATEAADAFERYLDLEPDAANADLVRSQIEELRLSAVGN